MFKQSNAWKRVKKRQFDKYILTCKYSPDKQYIVAGFTDGRIGIYESSTGKKVDSPITENISNSNIPVTSIQFKQNTQKMNFSRLLVAYTDGKVRLWNFETGTLIKELAENRQTLSVIYHPKLSKFITVGDNSSIYLYDEETMQLEHVYEKGLVPSVLDGHSSRVFTAVFHPQQMTEFVSGGWDNIIHFWDIRQPNSLRFIKDVHMCGEGLDISQSGRELLSCAYSKDNPIKLWHYKTGRLLSKIEPDLHKSMLYCGQWMTPDYILVGGTDPSLARIISMKTLSTVMSFKGDTSGVYSIDHYLKAEQTKREKFLDFKIVLALGQMLVKFDISL